MNIITCIHTNSRCYRLKGGTGQYPALPTGIVVHSTGANNPNLKRYVQPSNDDEHYNELIKEIGKNSNNNSWNREVYKSVHYFIGKDANGVTRCAFVQPHNIAAWGVGNGSKGSFNYNPTAKIQFEMCEDNLSNADYALSCFSVATDLCVDLCLQYNWNADVIVSHKEAASMGYASSHGDPDNWWKNFGWNMNLFRQGVQNRLDNAREEITDDTQSIKDFKAFVLNEIEEMKERIISWK